MAQEEGGPVLIQYPYHRAEVSYIGTVVGPMSYLYLLPIEPTNFVDSRVRSPAQGSRVKGQGSSVKCQGSSRVKSRELRIVYWSTRYFVRVPGVRH